MVLLRVELALEMLHFLQVRILQVSLLEDLERELYCLELESDWPI